MLLSARCMKANLDHVIMYKTERTWLSSEGCWTYDRKIIVSIRILTTKSYMDLQGPYRKPVGIRWSIVS